MSETGQIQVASDAAVLEQDADPPSSDEKVVPIEKAREERTGGSGGSDDLKPAAPSPPGRSPFTVAEIKVGRPDSRGERVDRVYFCRQKYAIYECKRNIYIHYADTEPDADQQIKSIASLIPLRDQLQYLVSGIQSPGCYRAQIAEALRLGLENQIDAAQAILKIALDDAKELRARVGRLCYLKYAGALGLAIASILLIAGGILHQDSHSSGLLMMASGGGAVGALLSIALAIRARTIPADAHWATNAMDGAVRVVIGLISAGALYLLMASGFINEFKTGDVTLTGTSMAWEAALLVGFAAGFLERLVPDLLEKKQKAP